MNSKISIRAKYLDLLPLQPDHELERLLDDFDNLCNSKQPPSTLINFDVVHSLQARQAESARKSPYNKRPVTNIGQRLRLRRHRFARWQWLLFGIFAFMTLAFVVARSTQNHNRVYEAQPVCTEIKNGGVIQNPSGLSFNCVNFSIQDVTVDADRLTVQYLFDGEIYSGYKLVGLRLTDEQGHELKYIGDSLSDAGSEKSQNFYYNKMSGMVQPYPNKEWFDASSLSNKAGTITLHLEIAALQPINPQIKGQDQTLTGPFHFELTTTKTNEKAQITLLNQNDTVNGTTATLEKVVVMPTTTRFYFQGLGDGEIQYELRAGQTFVNNDFNTARFNDVTQSSVTFSNGLTIITLDTGLLNETGEWTMIVKSSQNNSNYENPEIRGPWIFRFNLPPASPIVVTPPAFFTPIKSDNTGATANGKTIVPTPTIIVGNGKR